MDMQRVIHLDQKRLRQVRASRAGYSIGRWDGDVLWSRHRLFAGGCLNADDAHAAWCEPEVTER